MMDWVNDLRVGFRALSARPGFAVVAILTLGIGIGANTAIYTVVQAVLVRPLPFPEPERLVRLWETAERDELELRALSFPMVSDLASAVDVFEIVAARSEVELNLGTDAEPVRIVGAAATPSYFDVLGMTPIMGRFYADDDDGAVVVLSETLWRQRFGGALDIVGRPVLVNEVSADVIGVAAGAGLSGNVELWLPLHQSPAFVARISEAQFDRRRSRWLSAVARVQPGVTPRALDAWLATETERLRQDYPDAMDRRGIMAEPLEEQLLGDVQRTTTLLMVSVGIVMLIVCANLASLLLAKGIDRQREVSLRLALGATRGRVVRQLLLESLLLAGLGASAGVLLALWTSDLLRGASLLERVPRYISPRLDFESLVFAFGLAALTSLLFGAAPAFVAARSELSGTLRGARTTRRMGLLTGRGFLVTLQVAAAVLLTAGSALMIRSLTNQLRIEPGFRTDGLHTLRIQLPSTRYDGDAALSFSRALEDRLLGIPGVQGVAIGTDVPLVDGYSALSLTIEDRVRAGVDDPMRVYSHRVSPGFVGTFEIPLLAGRGSTWFDGPDAPLVVMVSEKLARRAWPDEAPLGKRVRIGDDSRPWRTVVGIVDNVRYRDLIIDPVTSPDDPDLYVPLAQAPSRELGVVIDAGRGGQLDIAAVRRELSALDSAIPVFAAQSMSEVLDAELALPRAATWLLSSFGAVALFLAALGLYGVLAQMVAQRARDIGIRMALGAGAGQVVRGIVGRGMALVSSGLVAGIFAAAILGRMLESRLFGVSGSDPSALVGAAALLLIVTLVATLIPAYRASRIHPTTALRQD